MLYLYQAHGSTDVELGGTAASREEAERLIAHAARLLVARGHPEAAEALRAAPFILRYGTNDFNDDFVVLHAVVSLETYEALRKRVAARGGGEPFRLASETLSEIGPYVRMALAELDMSPTAHLSEAERARALSPAEVRSVVEGYIGVSRDGYLGDFVSYAEHRKFYRGLALDINPDEHPGTTRVRFTRILAESPPDVQAQILDGVLERFPPGSEAPGDAARTERSAAAIRTLTARLRGSGGVAAPAPALSSDVVERALADARALIGTSGATSAVDRAHTAFHGYLRVLCDRSGIFHARDATAAALVALLRERHPAFSARGPQDEEVRKLLKAMGSIADALGHIRNQASVAHPNAALLEEPEAMLAINAVYALLHYVDAKLARAPGATLGGVSASRPGPAAGDGSAD